MEPPLLDLDLLLHHFLKLLTNLFTRYSCQPFEFQLHIIYFLIALGWERVGGGGVWVTFHSEKNYFTIHMS